eukprot:4179730-Lingulodinium_polyedra.AAC.1
MELFAGLSTAAAAAPQCPEAYDADTHEALAALHRALPPDVRAEVDGYIAAAAEEAERRAAIAHGRARRAAQRPADFAES